MRTSQSGLLFVIVLLSSAVIAGCDTTGASTQVARPKEFAGKYPIQVVCTTGMVADLAKNIGGEHVAVMALMGAGVDPHLYTASPADVSQLSRADIVLYSGLHLEGKLAELLERMGERKPTSAVAEQDRRTRRSSATRAARTTRTSGSMSRCGARRRLRRPTRWSRSTRRMPRTYRANLKTYQAQPGGAARVRREQMRHDPQGAPRAGHRARRVPLFRQGLRASRSAASRASAPPARPACGGFSELVDFLVERKIKAVFVETSVSDQNIRSLLEGAAARGHTVVIGGTLFSDAMGDEGTPEGTYEGMVRHNVDTIVKALK